MESGEVLGSVMRRYPTGVSVVTVDANGQRVGLTVATLVTLSLDPPLVGVAVARQAALHELLGEAGGFGVSLLAAGQEHVAQHFARGVPPIAMWHGIDVEPGDGPPLLSGAVGWLRCTLRSRHESGTHSLFVGGVDEARPGAEGPPLVRLGGGYTAP